jgi:hypothetical protein
MALTLALSQRERGLAPFSLWEKGGDEGVTCQIVDGNR